MLTVALLATSDPSAAQLAPHDQGHEQLRQAFQNLMTLRGSFDTTPVGFSMAGVVYRVPRNYIVTMNDWSGGPQTIVSLRVSLPDLKPVTPENVACFSNDPEERPNNCEPLMFRLELPNDNYTAPLAFSRSLMMYNNKTPLPGPNGFKLYYYGSDDARSEDYVGFPGSRLVMFTCIIGDLRDRLHGQCEPVGDATAAGTALSFWFPYPELSEIISAEPKIRKLIDGFVIERQ